MYKIFNELQAAQDHYNSPIEIVDGLNFSQKDTIKMIEYYSSSKYMGPNGQKDEKGRDKPFHQILNAICDVENAAKDIDTKDITVTSDDGEHYTESFLMSKDIYEWMKEENFAKTLNDMRNTHTRYGSLLVKKCIETVNGEKKLLIEIPEWKNLRTDQVDIANGVIIEEHYMLPTEIMKMAEWKNKEEVIKLARKENKKNYTNKRITVYEIRGEFPRSYIKELDGEKITESEETDYSYQLYYLAGDLAGKLVPLYWEDDTEKVYKYLARKKKAGRAFGVGVFEEGEEAQVWTNDAILKQFRAMEYTSKVVAQTASKRLKNRNILSEVDDGQVLEHEDGKPIEPINLLPSGGLNQYQNVIAQWYSQLEKTTSAYSAQRGESPDSGTPFRLQATVLQQSSSVFKDLQEELGIFITEIFEDWIMPFLAKRLNQEHILAHEYSMDELKEIDRNFATYHANEIVKRKVLSGEIVTAEDYETAMQTADEFIKATKSQRFLSIPKDYYKKFKAKITVNVTGEQRNKAAVLESLINIMTVYAQNPMLAQDPVMMQIFMKIVELSGAGLSPVTLAGAIQEQAQRLKQLQEQQSQQMQQEQPKQPQKQLSLQANPA